jgi:NAD(P)H-flavin reductase
MTEAANPYLPTPRRITRATQDLADVFTFDLDVADGGGFAFAPGQFNMLYLHGVGEVAISVSGDPGDPSTLTHTIRAVGTVTRPMQKLRVGDWLGVRGPYGTPWPLDKAVGRDLVIVAGGLGLAPLRPLIVQALARREQFGRVVVLIGARSPADLLFMQDVATWRGRFDVQLDAIVDRADRSWRGPVGVVTRLVEDADFDGPNATAFVCGPEAMMRFVGRALVGRNLTPGDVWLSMERSMKCGVGLCGHCQWGPTFVCKEGPVYSFDRAARLLATREI